MKVLYVNTEFEGGGAARVMRQLQIGMKKEYATDTYCIVGKGVKSASYTAVYDTKFKKAVNLIRRMLQNNARMRDRYTRKQILSCIQENRIDIVHLHNIHGNYLGIADIKEISRHCKIVWTLHDMWAITGHCAHSMNCEKGLERACRGCSNLKNYPALWVDNAGYLFEQKRRYFTNSGIYYAVPSRWLYEKVENSYLSHEKVSMIHNGVNIDTYKMLPKEPLRTKYKIGSEKLVLLFAANNIEDKYKGFEVLAAALNCLAEKEKFFLVVVGNGPVDYLDYKFERHLAGRVNEESVMNEYYALADIFIVPSKAENYPCSILESMASGTPVLASNTGGIMEQIDENTGWVFENGNVKKLCSLLENLEADREAWHKFSKNCRTKAEKTFHEKNMLNQYYQLYQKVLEDKEQHGTICHSGS